jgi:hypothetical protein
MSVSEHDRLIQVDLDKLRPAQVTAGLAEAAHERAAGACRARKISRSLLEWQGFRSGLGSRGRRRIADHRHVVPALMREGAERARGALRAEPSCLATAMPWRAMEHRNCAHPFDRAGEWCDFNAIPARIVQFVDDPYRSLSGLLRGAGGCAKDAYPCADFLWVDDLRRHVTATPIGKSTNIAVREAQGLAKGPRVRYLPCSSGITPAKAASAER